MEEGRRYYVGQKAEETTEMKSIKACFILACMCMGWLHCTDKETE